MPFHEKDPKRISQSGSGHLTKEKKDRWLALVIGNAKYKHVKPLKNPRNDAQAVAEAFTRMGYCGINLDTHSGKYSVDFSKPNVTPLIDLDRNQFTRAVVALNRYASEAYKAVIYYAGHGVEVGGKNYLIPIDANLQDEADIAFTQTLGSLVGALEKASEAKLIILDACRDNPFDLTRNVSGGLAKEPVSSDMRIAYSADLGKTANDGGKGESHSPYTKALLSHIEAQTDTQTIFTRIRADIKHLQKPYFDGSFDYKQYLVEKDNTAKKAVRPQEPIVSPPSQSTSDLERIAASHWDTIKSTQDATKLQAFIVNHGSTSFKPLAVSALNKLAKTAWRRMSRRDKRDTQALESFIKAYEGTQQASIAEKTLAGLENPDPGGGSDKTRWLIPALCVGAIALAGAGWFWGDEIWSRIQGNRPSTPSVDQAAIERKIAQAFQTRLSQTTSRDALVKLLSSHPGEREAIESRLKTLGYIVVKTGVRDSWQDQWLKPGNGKQEQFKDCDDCPSMVVLPAGSFKMGGVTKDSDTDEDDTPGTGGKRVPITFKQPFAVGQYEVTAEEYQTCVKDTDACDEPAWDEKGSNYNVKTGTNDLYKKLAGQGALEGRHPIVGVSWNNAIQYVRWLSKKTGQKYRLLSEAEWEYAARGNTGQRRKYWWGNEIKKNGTVMANCYGCGSQWDNKRTAPVGSFDANPFGLHDMHGNVWEWVEDCYRDSYADQAKDGSAWKPSGCEKKAKVLRGGSWYFSPNILRSANRNWNYPDFRNYYIGFRVGRSVFSPSTR